jgi:hypothetical protein
MLTEASAEDAPSLVVGRQLSPYRLLPTRRNATAAKATMETATAMEAQTGALPDPLPGRACSSRADMP